MFTFQHEKLSDILEEMKPLHVAQWLEVGERDVELNPDYEALLHHENIGVYHVFTIRERGKLVGNCSIYLSFSIHTRELVAQEDTLFILKDYRRGFLAIKFLKWVESELQKQGVVSIDVDSHVARDASDGTRIESTRRLLERLGYDLVGYKMRKRLNVQRTRAATAA